MRKIDEPARGGTKHLPVASGGISRLAYRRAQAEGINLDAQLKMSGLTRAQIDNPRAQIKVRDQIKFLNFVASALNDDFLGFRLAQLCDLREIGLLYYVLASSETLIDALQRAVRYSTIVNEGVSQTCIMDCPVFNNVKCRPPNKSSVGRVRFQPIADIASCNAHVYFRG